MSEEKTKKYEKPTITKQTRMTFPMDLINAKSGGRVCRQCSACHGCR
jgi:cytochrome c2